ATREAARSRRPTGWGVMMAAARSWSARPARPLSAWADMERALDDFDEVALLAQDQSLRLRHGDVLARLWIGLQARAVAFVRGQAVEGNQTPRHIVGALIREKVPDQTAPAPRDDAPPVRRVRRETLSLNGVDLVTDHAGDHHGGPLGVRADGQTAAAGAQRRTRRRQDPEHLAPADR